MTTSRGASLERIAESFRTMDLDVAQITLEHVSRIVAKRVAKASGDVASQVAAISAPRRTRTRKARVTMGPPSSENLAAGQPSAQSEQAAIASAS